MKLFAAILLLLFSPLIFLAQDAHFTQFYSSPLQLNPSMTGSTGKARIAMCYRDQWQSIYKTQYYSYDQHVNKMKGGVGLIYSPNFIIKNFSVKPSLEIDYFQKRIDWSKLTFGDQFDPRYGSIYLTNEVPGTSVKSGIDFCSGILVNTRKWNGGFAVHHLTTPDEGLIGSSKLPRKYTLHSSYTFSNSDSAKFSFSPSVLIMKQGVAGMILPSISFRYKKFAWGLGYRIGDAAIAMLGFRGKYFRLGYSYDMTVSKLATFVRGSHEVNLNIFFHHKNKESKIIPLNEIAF